MTKSTRSILVFLALYSIWVQLLEKVRVLELSNINIFITINIMIVINIIIIIT